MYAMSCYSALREAVSAFYGTTFRRNFNVAGKLIYSTMAETQLEGLMISTQHVIGQKLEYIDLFFFILHI